MINEKHNEHAEIAYVHLIFHCGRPTVEAMEKTTKKIDETNVISVGLIPTKIMKPCGNSSAYAEFNSFEIRKMANAVDGALGNAALQTKICVQFKQLPWNPFEISNQ